MRSALCLVVACTSLSAAACKSDPPKKPAPEKAAEAAPAAKPAPAPAAAERPGVFVPAESDAISIWPEAYSGELLVVEVLPQGSEVKAGDVVARLDTRTIDDQIHTAELEARSAQVRYEGVVEKNKIDDDAAAAALQQAKAALDRARRTLEGWTKHELAFARRGDELGRKNEDAGIDDQKDELAQLESMYKADELVDATEEIVMKRSKRRLAISEDARTLTGDRRKYRVDYDEVLQTEIKEEAVRTQELALDRLVRNQAIEKRAREDALARSRDAFDQQNLKLEKLRRDRAKFAVQSPRPGVLLHGKEKDYRPGKTPARYERGSQLSARNDCFLVADPESLAVAIEVPESMLKDVHDGSAAEVRPVAVAGDPAAGALHVETYPAAKAGDEGGYEGLVRLERAIPGVLFGMRAKVKFENPAATPEASPTASSGAH